MILKIEMKFQYVKNFPGQVKWDNFAYQHKMPIKNMPLLLWYRYHERHPGWK